MTMSAIDTYRAAYDYIQRFGEHARCRAEAKVAFMRYTGNNAGVATWRSVLAAIKEIQEPEPGNRRVH